MARSAPKNIGRAKIVEARCPICKILFKGQYCPTCGLPISTTQNKRPEFTSYKEYQLCDSCDTINPFGAKYCKKCGKEMSLHAKDKNGHGWVDLGLSVLWSTETMSGFYLWNNSNLILNTFDNSYNYINNKNDGKDPATIKWGEKWRTPTKEEFEELIRKCKWEKCLDSSNNHALKAIGPNGNSIIIPVTGYAGCENDSAKKEYVYSNCSLWTSTECIIDLPRRRKRYKWAYGFSFQGYTEFYETLTAKERKKLAFKCEFPFSFDFDLWGFSDNSSEKELKRKKYQERRKEQEKILAEMGDDWNEKMENRKKDRERRATLWLDTPIEFFFNMDDEMKNTIHPTPQGIGMAIRPVADKKWLGKL